jgi:multiple sugar transport system ATP-binding protein
MAQIILKNVNKVYKGDVKAVKDVNLAIKDNEFLVLVGPSGCGKSTTLRMIAGLEEISQGSIQIDNRIVNDVPAKDRDIAMVFQNYALYPHMTVFENMSFGLKKSAGVFTRLQRSSTSSTCSKDAPASSLVESVSAWR